MKVRVCTRFARAEEASCNSVFVDNLSASDLLVDWLVVGRESAGMLTEYLKRPQPPPPHHVACLSASPPGSAAVVLETLCSTVRDTVSGVVASYLFLREERRAQAKGQAPSASPPLPQKVHKSPPIHR